MANDSSAMPIPSVMGAASDVALPAPGPAGNGGNGNKMNGQEGCGLPRPRNAGADNCPAGAGGNYCRGAMGSFIDLAPLATGVITVTPTNAREVAARWLHMTATSGPLVSPVTFTQAFTVSAIQILGDNQMANAGPVIGSTWAAEQTDLREFWNKYITASNALTITVTNPDPALPIRVFASIKGDFNKS